MKIWPACAALALLCAAPAWAEVVINEIETNPPGDDSEGALEWVELYNSGEAEAYIGGWQISSSSGEALVLPDGALIGPGEYAAFSHGPLWFANRGDSARLLDAAGREVDSTPRVADVGNDQMTWQRARDGADTGSPDDWKPGKPTWNSSNGGTVPVPRSVPTGVSLDAGGPYVSGQPVEISGSVSAPAHAERHRGVQLPVEFAIEPSEYRTARYPDAALGFSFEVPTGGVLGLAPGRYTVTASYAGASAESEFEVVAPPAESDRGEEQSLSLSIRPGPYLRGQSVEVSASAAYEVPLEGLQISVFDPDGLRVESGALFPDGDGRFSTSYTVNPVSAKYGDYSVVASYGGARASAGYEVAADTRPAGLVMDLSADAYEPGQTVLVHGSSSKWVPSLEVRIASLVGGDAGHLNRSDSVRLAGDGSFSYELYIPEWFADYGKHLVTVSGSVGRASHEFAVAEDAASYEAPLGRFVVDADRGSYAPGQKMVLAGNVGDLKPGRDRSVSVDFFGPSGQVIIEGRDGASRFDVASRLAVLPSPSGEFSAAYDLNPVLFPPGQYVARAQYGGGLAAAAFEVEAPGPLRALSASLDKDVYGLGETVELSGASADADDSAVITLYKPDGGVERHGAYVDSGRFEWSWQAPLSEITRLGPRSEDLSNLGSHRLNVVVGGAATDLKFSVLADTDAPPPEGLTVSAGSGLHLPGSELRVSGTARTGGPSPVLIDVISYGSAQPILSARAYPGPGGLYSASFPLLASLFPDGSYAVRAAHDGQRAVDAFDVGASEPLSVEMARDEYSPGELAVARVSVPDAERNYSVGVIRQSGTEQACGPSVCGEYDLPVASATASGSFSYAYRVPHGAAGAHELTVWSGPHEAHALFEVGQSERRQESRSRIHGDSAAVEVKDGALSISGSLLARASDSESVRLRLEAPGGACIIGPSPECAQSGPTRAPHSEARAFELDGQRYWLSYSGPGARAELFELGAFGHLPAGQYVLSVQKDGQQSSLYYRVSYAQ